MCDFVLQVGAWPDGSAARCYMQMIHPNFCSFQVVIMRNGAEELTPAAVKWECHNPSFPDTKWHVIPNAIADDQNLTGTNSLFTMQCEAVLTQYFCKNLVHVVQLLSRSLKDGLYEVPVPTDSSQGLRDKLMMQARDFTEEDMPGCIEIKNYLLENRWWETVKPMDTAEDMLDMIQPLLSCKSWDWHRAATAHVLMKWAGLLSIVGMDEGVLHNWQAEGSDYLHFLPMMKTLEGALRGHPMNVNVQYIHGVEEFINETQIDTESKKLTDTFHALHWADPPQLPTQQMTADACASLNIIQVMSGEIKSSSDSSDAGFKQQALLLANFFDWCHPNTGPPMAIGLHLNSEMIRIQPWSWRWRQMGHTRCK